MLTFHPMLHIIGQERLLCRRMFIDWFEFKAEGDSIDFLKIKSGWRFWVKRLQIGTYAAASC